MAGAGRRVILLATAVWVALGGCRSPMPPEANLRNHRNAAGRFALSLPADWGVAEATDTGEAFMQVLPEGRGKLVVTVLVEDAPGIRGLEEYLRSSRQQFSRVRGYDELRAEVVRHSSGREAYVIDAVTPGAVRAGATDGPGGERKRFKQYGFLLGGRQYLITAVVPAEEGERWMGQVDPILNSFLIW